MRKSKLYLFLLSIVVMGVIVSGCNSINPSVKDTVPTEVVKLSLNDKVRVGEDVINRIYGEDYQMLEYINDFAGKQAPELKIQDLEGNEVTLDSFKGENIIIEFMGTWCPACETVAPVIEEFNSKNEDVRIISIALNSTKSEVEEYIASNNLNSTDFYLVSDEKMLEEYGIMFVPTFFYIDSDQVIQMLLAGSLSLDVITEIANQSFK